MGDRLTVKKFRRLQWKGTLFLDQEDSYSDFYESEEAPGLSIVLSGPRNGAPGLHERRIYVGSEEIPWGDWQAVVDTYNALKAHEESRERDGLAMNDLISKLERANAAAEVALVRKALIHAHKAEWITDGQYDAAIRMCDVGAYESAALSLVPEGWCGNVDICPIEAEPGCNLLELNTGREVSARAQTSVLALVIAALRAQGQGGGRRTMDDREAI